MKKTPHGEPGDVQRPSDSDRTVLKRCGEALAFRECGDYESARRALHKWWSAESARPRTDGLGLRAAGELLLSAGALTGSLGWARQLPGAQARARKFLAESARLFEQVGLRTKAAEARAEMASCLWRAGDHEAARRLLWKALAAMGGDADGLKVKAVTLLRAAAFEEQDGRLATALALLRDSAPLLDSCGSPVLLGKFHNNLGIVLKRLGEEPGREDFLDQALIECTAASFQFKQAGATRLLAHSENNHGDVLVLLGNFGEAAERLDLARALFVELRDVGHAAQVDETRARLLLEEGRDKEAERVAAGAVRTLGAGGDSSVLAEALTTWGKALARVGRPTESCEALGRAVQIAEKAGARETAGEAALAAVEELCGWLDPEEAINLYEFAYSRLEGGRHARARTLRRLGAVARTVYAPGRARNTPPAAPRLWDSARRLAGNNSPALITGKNAEARRLLACYAHALSGRPGRFVAIDCDTIEDETPRPEFFDWAMREAAGGILFLDRVDDLSRHLQQRLRDLISQGFSGDAAETLRREHLSARVVAGASCDLSRQVGLRCFDAGLFEALGGRGPHQAPSAQELEELRLLSACFDDEAFGRYGRATMNPSGVDGDEEWNVPFEERVTSFRADLIRKALLAADGHPGRAAQLLGMKRQTLEGMINNRKYQELQEWRTPVVKRGRGAVPAGAHDEESE